MQNIYEKIFSLRTSDFDCRRKILPSAVLDLFQVVAGEHAVALGCGFEELYSRQLLWVLVRIKYEVISEPYMYQQVKVKTWPLAPARVGFQREYLMEDLEGNILIKASSDWVIIHSEERKIVSAANIYPQMEFLTEKSFEQRLKKVPDFEAEGNGVEVCPGFSQLDMNGHVNNTKYANYAMDAFNPINGETVKAFQIDYRHEVQKGDKLTVYTHRQDETVLVKGVKDSGEVMFACQINI